MLKIKIDLSVIAEQQDVIDKLSKIEAVIDLRKQELTVLDDLIKARFVELFGDLKPTTTIARYISELRGGKSLAGTEECKNKVLKTGAATFGLIQSSISIYRLIMNLYLSIRWKQVM